MNEDFPRTLSKLRRERGISQRQAAKDLGVSQALLSHYENGAREPGLAFVVRACDYYQVSADFLLGRTLVREGPASPAPEESPAASMDCGALTSVYQKRIAGAGRVICGLVRKLGCREAAQAAGNAAEDMVYFFYRGLAQASGAYDIPFRLSDPVFSSGLVRAETAREQSRYLCALEQFRGAAGSIPAASKAEILREYPESSRYLRLVIHSAEDRLCGDPGTVQKEQAT